MGLYIHSPIRVHGIVLNLLSTGTTLTFLYIPYITQYFNKKKTPYFHYKTCLGQMIFAFTIPTCSRS
jgi:hypothetical protein